MKRLNEKEIIKIINSKHVSSEDVEIFNLGNEQCAVCVDTLVESTDTVSYTHLTLPTILLV